MLEKNVIAGDYNAQIGKSQHDDDERFISKYVVYHRSQQGELLAQWSTQHDFLVANTFFRWDDESAWTYAKGPHRSQLDYVLVGNSFRKRLKWCRVEGAIDIGSDHRPVAVALSCSPKLAKKKKKRKTASKWSVEVEKYQESLNESLGTYVIDQAPLEEIFQHCWNVCSALQSSPHKEKVKKYKLLRMKRRRM